MVLAIVIGLVLGAMFGGGFEALAGAVLGWLVVRTSQQARSIAALEQALRALRPGPVAQPVTPLSTPAPPEAADATDALVEPPLVEPPLAPARAPAATPADFAPTLPPAVATPAPAVRSGTPSPRSNPLDAIKRWFFGGNTIVKAGVGILFIGLAFLAKFASEHVQLPIELRLAGIGAAAIVLLVIGWRLRDKRPGYAHVLQGGAVAVLYLTLFVAFRFYGVLAVTPVFVLMVAVAALAAALAVLQDARTLAVIGALGGFATPLLVSSGSGNHVALFSYYLVLDLGIALVAWHRTWPSLNLIGFAGTFVVATAWGVLKYQTGHYATSQGFLVAFFLVFVAIMLMPLRARALSREKPLRSDAWVQGTLLFGLPTITFVLQHGLVRDTEYGSAVSALVLALFYIALAAWMRSRAHLAAAFEGSLAVGTVFTTLVIPFALDARSTAGAWALEGAGLVWLGLRQSRGLARAFGYALLLLAGAAMLVGFERHGAPATVFNAYLFNALMAAAAALAGALFVARRHGSDDSAGLTRHEALAEPLLIGWATLWLLGAAALQIDHFVPPRFELAAWLASVSAIALLYALLSLRLAWPRVALPVVAHAPLMALAALGLAVSLARPLEHGGWWAWPVALAVHALVLWRLASNWPAAARDAVHAIGALVLALLGALQGRALTADWGDAASAWAWLGWLVLPALLLMLLPLPAVARRWPVTAAPAAYRWIAAAVLAAGLLLWTLLANVASNGSARPLPYLPIVNPLDLGVAVALVAVLLWLRSEPARTRWSAQPGIPIALVGSAAFVWLNAMLVRAFHHFGDVPFRFDAWTRSLAVQTGITLLWTTTALVLMWLAARRALRLPWMVGAALLAAVVAKLLLVDLSGTGTVTRIVSFIGVGVLMLVIGYVAPLPGRGKAAAQEQQHA
jgi:uncharacterized membrane protein